MKIRLIHHATSSVRIEVPQGWTSLTPEILRYVCALLSSEIFSLDEIKIYLLAKLSGMSRTAFSKLPPMAVVNVIPELDWLNKSPEYPVRLPVLYKCAAVDAELHGVSFEDYLCLENLYQGYINTMSPEALDKMIPILYPGLKKQLNDVDRYSVFVWMLGLKSFYAKMFPDLFVGIKTDEPVDMRQVMIAEIRALTSGDVTKEKLVLNTDVWSALTELNEKSREYREHQRKMKK